MWLDKSCCILPRLGVIDGTGHHPRLPDISSLIIIFSVYFSLFIFKALGSHYFVNRGFVFSSVLILEAPMRGGVDGWMGGQSLECGFAGFSLRTLQEPK